MNWLQVFIVICGGILIEVQGVFAETYKGTLNWNEILWSPTEIPNMVELFDKDSNESLGSFTKIATISGENDFALMDGIELTVNACCYSIEKPDGTANLYVHIMENKQLSNMKTILENQDYDFVEVLISSLQLETHECKILSQCESITSLLLVKCKIPKAEQLFTKENFPNLKKIVLVLNRMDSKSLKSIAYWISQSQSIKSVYWTQNVSHEEISLIWENKNITELTIKRTIEQEENTSQKFEHNR